MDWLKDIYDAHNQKIKSPILGSIILAFIAWNWQAIFYVLFASNSVRMRLEYWDANVLFWQDYLMPLAIGLVLALSMPLISLLGAYASAWPTNELRRFTNKQAHKISLAKDELQQVLELRRAEHREELEKKKEELIASRARQSEELSKIGDEDERDKARMDVEQITSSSQDLENSDVDIGGAISKIEKDLSKLENLMSHAAGKADRDAYMREANKKRAKLAQLNIQAINMNSER